MVRLVLLAMFALPMMAADPFYFGKWKIVSAAVAPWWEDKAHPPADADMRSLVGKMVTFSAKEIQATRGACRNPNYVVKDYPADYLFQGAFGEMQRRNKSVDPVKVAANAGFVGKTFKMLETGCAFELDWHFIDANTAAFALDNYIYTMKKQ
jgi:hypothetical protein